MSVTTEFNRLRPVIRIFDPDKKLKETFTADKIVSCSFTRDLMGGDKEFDFELTGPPQNPIEIGDYVLAQRDEDEHPFYVGEVLRVPISNGLHLSQTSFPVTIIDELNHTTVAEMNAAGWSVVQIGCQARLDTADGVKPTYSCPARTLPAPWWLNQCETYNSSFKGDDEFQMVYTPPSPMDITGKTLIIWTMLVDEEGDTLDLAHVHWDLISDYGGPNEAYCRSDRTNLYNDFRTGNEDRESWYQWRMDYSFGHYDSVEPLFDPTNVNRIIWSFKKDNPGGTRNVLSIDFQRFIMYEPKPHYPGGKATYFKGTQFKYSGLGFYGRLAYWLYDGVLEYSTDYLLRDIWQDVIDRCPFIDHRWRGNDTYDYQMRIDRSTFQEISNECATTAGFHVLRVYQATDPAYRDIPRVVAAIFGKPQHVSHFLTEGVHFNFAGGLVDGSGLANYASLRTGLVDYSGTDQATNHRVAHRLYESVDLFGERRVVAQSPQNVTPDLVNVDRRAYADARDRGFPVMELSISDVNYTKLMYAGQIARLFMHDGSFFDVRLRSITYSFDQKRGFNVDLTLGEAHRGNPGRSYINSLSSQAKKGIDMMSANITQT